MYNFGPAAKGERFVFGSGRPGRSRERVEPFEVNRWIAYMQTQGIDRVVCLLGDDQLAYYPDDLLASYRKAFGDENVINAPIPDFHLASPQLLREVILPFLVESEEIGKKVVIHCSGGMGRTGHVLAAWLVHARGLPAEEALEAVRGITEFNRNPGEAVATHTATHKELIDLLESCRETL